MLRSPFAYLLLTLSAAFAITVSAPLHAALTKPVVPVAPAAPKIPAAKINLADFGGNPDGITLNTDAFTRAIAALTEKGGGTLIVPPGIWHTGPIALKSRINLHVEAGALIQFSRDTTLYPLRHFKARGETFVDSTSPLSGDNLEDIAITGSGVIDGGGDAWRLVKKAKMTEGAWNALVKSGGVLNDKKTEWWPTQAALEGGAAIAALEKKGSTDITEHAPWQIFLRPRMVRLLDCKRVLIEGVTVRNAPNWTLHPWLCEDLALRDVKIFNNRWAQNSDAMDIDSCRRVHVARCIIDTGDDGICIKSGINESGRRIGVPTEDVLVEDCVVYEGHGGFTIGSEMSGGVRNILVQNCTFIGTALGLRFKTARGRGGLVENIHMRGIRMSHIEGNAIDFNFFYWVQGHPQPTAPAVDEGTPQFRNMLFEDIVARDGTGTLVLRGLPEMPINNLTFRNVSLAGDKGADIAHSDAIVFENVSIEQKTGAALATTSVTNSRLDLAPPARKPAPPAKPSEFLSQPLVSTIYTADPAAHVFEGKLFLYPSHDIPGVTDKTDGNHYAMRDYHVFSMDDIGGKVTDHGVALKLEDVPWASRQLWAPDAAHANGRYYLYFPARDKAGVFRIGVATADKPAGPFKAEPLPIDGAYSIDPTVYRDDDGAFLLYFGGLSGGQLQQWPGNRHTPDAKLPAADQPAVAPRVARLRPDMLGLAEEAREIQLLDESGKPILAGDDSRRFFEGCWVHKHNGTYYFTYSTGTTHLLCYATGASPRGPFTYRGVLLKPVQGWTTHQSIIEWKGRWYLFYHDTQLSGQNNLRNVKVVELRHNPDGTIQTIDPLKRR